MSELADVLGGGMSNDPQQNFDDGTQQQQDDLFDVLPSQPASDLSHAFKSLHPSTFSPSQTISIAAQTLELGDSSQNPSFWKKLLPIN